MATEIGRGVVNVTFDKDQIGRDLHSSIDEGSRRAEGGIGSTFKRLAGVASAAFAGVQVFSFFKDAVGEAREAEKVAAQTEAVIKSTGGAAGVTAEQFSKLAESISLKTGIDDEQIQSAENLLATFTNLKNGVGENNDIFSQATKIAVDMGVALGGDASSNAIQLGKALNDPIKGISALTRVGVTFTDEQKNLIKSLQESGDMAGAQKVILAELNKEFGGSAEATATAGDKFKVFFGNLKENVGGFLIPLMDSVATWAMTTLPNAFGAIQDAVGPIFSEIGGAFSAFIEAFKSGTDDITSSGLAGWAEGLGNTLRSVWDVIGTLVDAFKVLIGPDGPQGFGEIMDNLLGNSGKYVGLFRNIGEWIIKVADFVKDNFKPILIGLVVAFGLLTAPITTVIAGFVLLYTQFPAVREGIATVVDAVRGFVEFFSNNVLPVIQTVVGYLIEQFSNFAAAVSERWASISEAIGNVITAITIVVAVALAPLILIWTLFHDQIMAVVQIVWDQIKLIIETAINIVVGVIDLALALLTGDWSAAWDALTGIVTAVFDLIKGTVGNAFAALGEVFSIALQAIAGVWSLAWGAMRDVVDGVWDGIVSAFEFVMNAVLGGLEGAVNIAIDILNAAIDALDKALGPWINFGEAPHVSFPRLNLGGGEVADSRSLAGKFHEGIWAVPGRPGEDVLAMLRAGETVISAQGTIGGQQVGGNTYQLSSGPVYVNEPQDIETAFARLELLAGV